MAGRPERGRNFEWPSNGEKPVTDDGGWRIAAAVEIFPLDATVSPEGGNCSLDK